MRFWPALILFTAVLCASAFRRAYSTPVPGKTVGKISVDGHDIFDLHKPSESGWIYRAANLIHVQTHENVIRRELLFRPGAPYDPDLVAETERNLRRFNFLRRVKIDSDEQPDGTVDLIVHTKDTWTLEPQADFSRVGNKSKTKIGLVERNLLGTGKRISAFYSRSSDGADKSFAYRDQQFMGRPLDLKTEYVNGDDFRDYGVSLSKPFRSTLSKTSFEISDFFTEEEFSAYRDGAEVGKFEREERQAAFVLGRSFRSTTEKTRQGTLAFRQESKSYEPLAGDTTDFIRAPIDLSIVEVSFDWQKIDFIKERHIEKFDRDEDFNLGGGVGFTFGVGQNWKNDKENELLPKLRGRLGHAFGPGHFTLLSATYRSRITPDTTDDLLGRFDVQYFNRLTGDNTLAGHIAYDHGYRLDPENKLLLGEETGLRGYSNGQFSGDRRLLVNIEDRMFFAEDVWHLVSFGGALFFDSGYAWGASHNFNASDMRSAVGFGFRIAPSRSSRNEPVRIDFAYALNGNQENSRFVVSVQSGVKFGGVDDETSGRHR